VKSATPSELADYLHLPSDCIAVFHILTRGQCWLSIPGSKPVMLRAGDAVLIPHNAPHVVGSDVSVSPVPFRSVLPPVPPPEGIVDVVAGTIGEVTQLVCGYLHCDQRFNPLLGALPAFIVMRCHGDGLSAGLSTGLSDGSALPTSTLMPIQQGDWLEMTVRHTAEEAFAERPGNTDMLARLSEILFVEVVRRYMHQLPAARPGWLAGVRDPIVGRALRLLHAHPDRAWTVEDLADAIYVSRSTLAQRFTELIGESPMRYLAAWRIQLAKYFLKQTNLNLAEVAERVGYDSDVAFNRAFRRHVGQPPAAWRIREDAAG
jgi:AraC family transcriptional regulator, alkane utilization regulator